MGRERQIGKGLLKSRKGKEKGEKRKGRERNSGTDVNRRRKGKRGSKREIEREKKRREE